MKNPTIISDKQRRSRLHRIIDKANEYELKMAYAVLHNEDFIRQCVKGIVPWPYHLSVRIVRGEEPYHEIYENPPRFDYYKVPESWFLPP